MRLVLLPCLAFAVVSSGSSSSWAAPSGAKAAEAARPVTFGLAVAVVARPGTVPVVEPAWVTAQVAEANALFGPLGVSFRVTSYEALPENHAEIRTPNDRDRLARRVHARESIPVFVVDVLEDVDEKGRLRMGVCWRKSYLILAHHAKETVLAHELGHYFGNGHSRVTDNLMSYSRAGGPVFLDAKQTTTIQAEAARFVRTGTLKALLPTSSP